MNPYNTKRLEQSWFALCERLDVFYGTADKWWNSIRDEYSFGGRHYHNIEHIAVVMGAFEERWNQYPAYYEDHRTLPCDDLDLILLAIWFHDYIYVFDGSVDNEIESARVARQFASEHTKLEPSQCQFVYDLIVATKHEVLYLQDEDIDCSKRFKSCAAALCDSDVSAMATFDFDYFSETNQNIRKEYAQVPDEVLPEARKAFFENFLARGGVFNLSIDGEEERALSNIQRMLDGD